MRAWIVPLLCLCFGAATASGQSNAFSFSTGYSRLFPAHAGGGGAGTFLSKDGAYVDGEVTWRVRDLDFPLLVGGGISGSGYYERERVFTGLSGGFDEEDHLFSDVGFFSIEGRAALPLRVPGTHGFFIEPRIGAGLLVDSYSIDHLSNVGGSSFITTDEHAGAAFELRPALRAGYAWRWGSVGAEVSYMAAWGDFGRLGSSAQELRAGAFVRFRF